MDLKTSAVRTPRAFRAAISALLLIACGAAQAASNCVDTSQSLQTKLNEAGSQAGPYIIRVVASATPYQLGPGNGYILVPPTTTIRGGYAPGCDSNQENASGTVIDFGGYPVSFGQANTDVPNLLKFSNLTLRHGVGFSAEAGSVHAISDEPGEIQLQNVRFTDFAGPPFGSPITFRATKGVTQLVDVQFDHIQPSHYGCAVWVQGDNDSFLKANFITADLTGGQHFCLIASTQSGALNARIDNSIIWGSDGGTPKIYGMDPSDNNHAIVLETADSLYHAFEGWGTIYEDNPIYLDPQWLSPAAADYRLLPTSPAVNSASDHGELGAPFYDIDHGLRTVGGVPDRGAHESSFANAGFLQVTSAADSGPQTLREAITLANQLGGQPIIGFALPSCPTVISLATPLPDVTGRMRIDGYTQSGSAPSHSEESFDANLCVLIKPATTAAYAFRIPSNANGGTAASLTLQGVGIGGFSQDIILLGGASDIRGNQFGGVANGIDLGSTALNIISIGGDAGASELVRIGGFGPENRNVIGGADGASGTAIRVQGNVMSDVDHCIIDNNWIGLAPDLSPLPNAYGIQLGSRGCLIKGNRVSASKFANLWINGGHDNKVVGNVVSDTSGLPNDAFGIRIDGDANIIGDNSVGGGNTVTDMSKGGVVVIAGSGNAIRANYVSWNGPNHDGLGMDIDLGGDGPSGNQSLPPPGPNNWQQFPEVDGLVYLDHPPGGFNTPAYVQAHLHVVPGVSYRIDAYFSATCSLSTGRAHAEVFLGETTAMVPTGAEPTANFAFKALLPSDTTGYIGMTATRAINAPSGEGNGTSEI
ncbi:MAG: right-handed parallel beta-helix repeat-containing protein, partial [Rhodanobacteraceae bacterium]